MSEKLATTRRTPLARKVLLGLTALFVVGLGGIAVWTTTCPCNQMPGFMLLGDVQKEPVTDWSFVNDIPLCQIQIYAGPMPHAVNLNCMATPDGGLFLSCGDCERKFWGRHVARERTRAPAPQRKGVPSRLHQGEGRGGAGPGLGGEGQEAAGVRRSSLQPHPSARRETAQGMGHVSAALGCGLARSTSLPRAARDRIETADR